LSGDVYDVSYTVNPAYSDTEIAMRSLDRAIEEERTSINWKAETRLRMLKLAKLRQG
jgi:phage head maturation protease